MPKVYNKKQVRVFQLTFTSTLQKPEGFRVKASEGEDVVLYFESSATQSLKSSGFPGGYTTWIEEPNLYIHFT